MKILGIDPGTATTGYGIIQKNKSLNNLNVLDFGCILTDKNLKDSFRLFQLQEKIFDLIEKHSPDLVAIERLFFFKNKKTIIKVSEARGVILAICGFFNKPVIEFSPLEIKTAVCGYGRAEKQQIQKMIKLILKLDKIPKPDDAADALAIAICAANLGNKIN